MSEAPQKIFLADLEKILNDMQQRIVNLENTCSKLENTVAEQQQKIDQQQQKIDQQQQKIDQQQQKIAQQQQKIDQQQQKIDQQRQKIDQQQQKIDQQQQKITHLENTVQQKQTIKLETVAQQQKTEEATSSQQPLKLRVFTKTDRFYKGQQCVTYDDNRAWNPILPGNRADAEKVTRAELYRQELGKLNTADFQSFCEGLKHFPNITEINLSVDRAPDADQAVNIVKSCPNLKKLLICANSMTGNALNRLAQNLLENLLAQNGVENLLALNLLAQNLKNDFEMLSLTGKVFTDDNMKVLSKAWNDGRPKIKKLVLRKTKVTEKGVEAAEEFATKVDLK